MAERGFGHPKVLLAVAGAAVVLAPSHLARVSSEVGAGDVMVRTDLGPTEAREERLGLVRAGVVSAVRLLMVDALGQVALVKHVPTGGLVSMDGAALGDPLADRLNRSRLALEDEGKSDPAAFAHDDHDPTLAGLVDGEAPVYAVLLVIGGLHVAPEVGAIHLHRAGDSRLCLLGRNRLPELMSEDEGGAVLDVEVAGELERAVTLGAVGENRHRHQVIADRELAVREDGAAGHAVLMGAALALPQLAGGEEAVSEAATTRAVGLALGLSPADELERGPGFVVRHAGNAHEAQRVCISTEADPHQEFDLNY